MFHLIRGDLLSRLILIIAAFDICQATMTNLCNRYAEGGLEGVLHDKVQQN
jgi:hypothetical protein